MPSNRKPGYVLSELMLAVTVGVVIVTIVGQELNRSRIASDERAAMTALRSIMSAQAQLASSDAIDSNGNRVGEFGYLGELAGSAPLRVYDPVLDAPALDANNQTLSQPLLPPDFANFSMHDGETELERGGYRFKMYLPDVTWYDNDIAGIPETGFNGLGGATAGYFPDSGNCEELWGCYAWPNQDQRAGGRVYFVNQEGRLLQTANDVRSGGTVLRYDGPGGGPAYGAALSNLPRVPNGPTGMGAPLGTQPWKSNDGNVWIQVGR